MSNEQANPEELSLSDLVEQAFDQAEEGTLEVPETVETEVEDETHEAETEDDTEVPDADEPEAAESVEESESEEDQTESERDPTLVAPSSWSKSSKSLYDKLPDDVKREVHKREADFHAGYQQLKPKADFADRVAVAIQPYQQTLQQLQQQGIDAPTAINKLLQADHILRYSEPSKKAEYLAELAVQYGVDIRALSSLQAPDPNVIAMKQQLEAVHMQRQQEMIAQQAQQQQGLMQQIQEFAADPKNEHFALVRDEMAILLDQGKAATLQEAYDKAVWMRPDIRQTLLDRRETEAKRKALEATQRKRAKTASVSVKGSQAGKPGKPASDDIRGILESLVP